MKGNLLRLELQWKMDQNIRIRSIINVRLKKGSYSTQSIEEREAFSRVVVDASFLCAPHDKATVSERRE